MSILPSSSGSDLPSPRALAAALRASIPDSAERRRLETAFAVRLLPGLLRSLRATFRFGRVRDLPHDFEAYGDFWMDGANWGLYKTTREACNPRAPMPEDPEAFAFAVACNRLRDVLRALKLRRLVNMRPAGATDDPSCDSATLPSAPAVEAIDAERFGRHVTALLRLAERSDAALWVSFFTLLAMAGPTDVVRAHLPNILRTLAAAVAACPDRDRAAAAEACAVVLYLLDIAVVDMAAVLGLAPSSVPTYYARGKARLEPLLRRELGLPIRRPRRRAS